MPPRHQDLFLPVVTEEQLGKSFSLIMKGRSHRPARRMMQRVFDTFTDIDGNFVEQFQTTGFDARIWELYLNAYLADSGFSLERAYHAPDFVASREGICVCIEAVTANPSANMEEPPVSSAPTQDEIERLRNWHVIRLGSALYSKLRKRYWELPHVKGKPLILAIENFSSKRSLSIADSTLATYLFGIKHDWTFDLNGELVILPEEVKEHSIDHKTIPSGFFSLPETEHVSAVLFSNSGTIAKFNRMGHQGEYRQKSIQMIRVGTCHNPDPNATEPFEFRYEVGDARYRESWGQGLSLLHNPNALHPLPADFFPGAAEHRLQADGQVVSDVPAFHPYASVTQLLEYK